MEHNLKIQIFAHSIGASGRKNHTNNRDYFLTWSDKIINDYGSYASIDNEMRSVIMQSEERILVNLKKSYNRKNVDIAIIFHGHPSFFYMPSMLRDWKDHKLEAIFHDVQLAVKYLFKKRFLSEVANKSLNEFDLIQGLYVYQDLFYEKELHNNRFIGALTLIDQFCTGKKIPVIHCPLERHHIPNYFKFTSGVVDYQLASLQYEHMNLDNLKKVKNPYLCGYNQSPNAINEEGNELIYKKMKEYIDRLIEEKNL